MSASKAFTRHAYACAQSPERTLADEDAGRLCEAIVSALADRFGATAGCTLSSKIPEPPRGAPNLSPRPIPEPKTALWRSGWLCGGLLAAGLGFALGAPYYAFRSPRGQPPQVIGAAHSTVSGPNHDGANRSVPGDDRPQSVAR
jgi:hypothetical protein